MVDPADLPRLAVVPPPNYSGSFELTIRATSREADGESAASQATFHVKVEAVADAPDFTVLNAAGQEDKAISLAGLSGALRDTDGSETLSFVLSGVPAGASLNAGTKQTDGTFLLTPSQLAGLTFTPPPQASGRFTLTLTCVATENTGGTVAHTSVNFSVEVNPVADAGTIQGARMGYEDTAIVLAPT